MVAWPQTRRVLAALAVGLLAACGGGAGSSAVETGPDARRRTAAAFDGPTASGDTDTADITRFGGQCDGAFDNSAALALAAADARLRDVPVVIPAGVCAHGDVINLDGIRMLGTGPDSVLYALDPTRAAIFLTGDGASLSDLRLTGAAAVARLESGLEGSRVVALGATNFRIERLVIEGSAAAGIAAMASARAGVIADNTVRDTLADGIHLSGGSGDLTVVRNRVERAGDDGIAVVSYQGDGEPVRHVLASDNVVLDNVYGRNMSVVGGTDILYENNWLEGNRSGYACLYIAQEDSFATLPALQVRAIGNSLTRCGSERTGHAAALLYAAGSAPNSEILFQRNDLVLEGQWSGLAVYGAANRAVVLEGNRVNNAAVEVSLDPALPAGAVSLIPYAGGAVGANVRP